MYEGAPLTVIAEEGLDWGSLDESQQIDLISRGDVIGVPMLIPNLLVKIGFAESTSQARALIKQGGVTVGPAPNRVKVNDVDSYVIFLMESERSEL
jgi:hypothetical protein